MKKSLLFISLLGMFVLIVSGCGRKEVEPVAIDEKNDKCIQCNMAVLDDQFATQLVLENGKVHTFDDIGCMFKWSAENKGTKISSQFVRDYESKEWIKVEDATYVYDKSIITPMAYNVISFGDGKRAKEFAAETNAIVMSGTEINDHNWGMSEENGSSMNHSHDE